MTRKRSTANALAQLLGDSDRPVYAIDDRRTIVYCNAALAAWVGLEAEALAEVRCDYHSHEQDSPEKRIAAGLCPPPECFAGGGTAEPRIGEIACRTTTGELRRRRAEFLPLGRDPMHGVGVLVVCETHDLSAYEVAVPPSSADPDAAQLHERLRLLRHQHGLRYRLDRLLGESPAMRRVREQAKLAADGPVRTVIVGPPGSGREHVARAIHCARPAASTLVPLACELLDPELIQSTIASLGRQRREAGDSQTPTLLLLEVDQLPPAAQQELAGYLQLPSFKPQTLATARRSPLKLAADGAYSAELAHMLGTLVIELPPLSERRADVPLLAQLFLEEANAAGGRQLSGFTAEALDELAAYPWPGNLDELSEFVREACRKAEGPFVTPADLPPRIRHALDAAAYPRRPDETLVLSQFLADVEAELIRRALQRSKGNKAKAARLLGISRPRLLRRIEQLKIA